MEPDGLETRKIPEAVKGSGAPGREDSARSHPAAREIAGPLTDKRRGWLIWLVAFVIGIGFAGYLRLARSSKSDPASAQAAPLRQAVPVAAAQAKSGDLDRYLTAIGTVTALNTVTVKSRVDGQIMRIDFKEGQFVKQGQPLIQIDPRPYQAALTQAEGQLARDRAALTNAKILLDRDRALLKQNVIARQDFDNQLSTAQQNEGSVIADEGLVANDKLQLSYSRITAPINGRIGLRMVDIGNMVHATDAGGLAVITQLQPISALFSIPEDSLPEVMKDLRNTEGLPVQAYDRELKHKLADGTLLTVDNQIDTSTGTVRLKATFPNDDSVLFPNQFINIKLLVDKLQDKVLIPSAAVQRSPTGTFVYLVRPDKTVGMRPVTVAATQGDQAAIESGLSAGEVVVTEGVDRLQPGTRVSVQLAQAGAGANANTGTALTPGKIGQ